MKMAELAHSLSNQESKLTTELTFLSRQWQESHEPPLFSLWMASSEVDQKFLGHFAKTCSEDNVYLSSMVRSLPPLFLADAYRGQALQNPWIVRNTLREAFASSQESSIRPNERHEKRETVVPPHLVAITRRPRDRRAVHPANGRTVR